MPTHEYNFDNARRYAKTIAIPGETWANLLVYDPGDTINILLNLTALLSSAGDTNKWDALSRSSLTIQKDITQVITGATLHVECTALSDGLNINPLFAFYKTATVPAYEHADWANITSVAYSSPRWLDDHEVGTSYDIELNAAFIEAYNALVEGESLSFMIRWVDEDVGETTPVWSANNTTRIDFAATPSITLTYSTTLPECTAPTALNAYRTSAELSATLTSDGGGSWCWARFQYGTTTFYGKLTPWVSVAEGSDLTAMLEGLTPSTEYHCRAQARNAAGTFSSDDVSFETNELARLPRQIWSGDANGLWYSDGNSDKRMVSAGVVFALTFPLTWKGGSAYQKSRLFVDGTWLWWRNAYNELERQQGATFGTGGRPKFQVWISETYINYTDETGQPRRLEGELV